MNISEFCIRRPVFTILLMVSLCVSGIVGYRTLVVSALPKVDFPTISVSAQLSGANPETMSRTVATILEKQFSTISSITAMTSTSTTGSSNIILQFDLDRDIDGAALDVQTAISGVLRKLPKEMTTPPSFQKVNPSDQPVLFVSLNSEKYSISELTKFADDYFLPKLSTINGVAQVNIFGAQRSAYRIQVNPIAMRQFNIGFAQISSAVSQATSNAPLGSINGEKQSFVLEFNTEFEKIENIENIIVAWRGNSPIKLSQIANIKQSVDNVRVSSYRDGVPAINIAISRQPGANTIDVVDNVKKTLPQIKKQLPEGIDIIASFDRAQSIKDAVHDVQLTLLFTIFLVVIVIYGFLTNWRATLIPAITVPLSIIATAGGMAILGFSINNISLMAITLCVGLVVDDAIVVMENIISHLERGEKIWHAAINGAKEINFTIISITFSLVAVFLPILLMGGVVGRFFKEFALTISMSLVISGFISLTLTPMLCAKLLGHYNHHDAKSATSKFFNLLYDKMEGFYKRTLQWFLVKKFITLSIFFITLFASVALYVYTPKGFIPQEDTGFIFGFIEGAQDASFTNIVQKQQKLAEIIRANPAVDSVNYSTSGGSSRIFIALKEKSKRPPMQAIIGQLKRASGEVEGVRVFFNPVQNLNIGGRFSKSAYQYSLLSADLDILQSYHDKMLLELQKNNKFQDVTSDLSSKNLTAEIVLNQAVLERRNINTAEVRNAIYASFGNNYISSIYNQGTEISLIVEIDPSLTINIDSIAAVPIVINNPNGNQVVSLGEIASVKRNISSSSVNHQGQLPSATIAYNLAPNVSLGEAQEIIESLNKKLQKPESISALASGTAQAFKDSNKDLIFSLILAIVVIYLILGMLYESFIHPITILSGIPSAGCGALIFLNLFDIDLNLIAMIGIILLIGLVKKNAIMMIDFAINARNQGKSAHDAISEACYERFRPIMMTSFAAFFGTLPIAIGFGAGAELRQPLGVAIVGGLLISQILTLYITPIIYIYMDKFAAKKNIINEY